MVTLMVILFCGSLVIFVYLPVSLVLQLKSQPPTSGAPGQLLVHQLLKAVQWCVLWRTEKTLPWPGTEEREDGVTQIVTNTH